jgi:hypothetical protein
LKTVRKLSRGTFVKNAKKEKEKISCLQSENSNVWKRKQYIQRSQLQLATKELILQLYEITRLKEI